MYNDTDKKLEFGIQASILKRKLLSRGPSGKKIPLYITRMPLELLKPDLIPLGK